MCMVMCVCVHVSDFCVCVCVCVCVGKLCVYFESFGGFVQEIWQPCLYLQAEQQTWQPCLLLGCACRLNSIFTQTGQPISVCSTAELAILSLSVGYT